MAVERLEKPGVPREQAVRFTVRQVTRLLAVMALVALATTLIELQMGMQAELIWQLLLPFLVPLIFLPVLYRIVLKPTAKFAMQQAVEEVQEALQNISNALREGIAVTDKSMVLRYANHAAERMLGYPPGALAGTPVLQLATEKDLAYLTAQAEEYQRTGTAPIIESGVFELDVRRRDGSTIPVEITLNHFHIYGQRLLIAILRDVSQRRLLEEMLRRSEAYFRMLADTAPAMLYLTNAAGENTYVNQTWLDFVGRTKEQEAGWGWADSIHPEDAARVHEQFRSATLARAPYQLEYRIRTADGSWRWVYDEGRPRFGADSEFLGYIGARVDFTARKQVEEQLEAQTALLDALVRSNPMAIVTLDAEGRTELCNPAFERLFQYSAAEMQGKFLDDLIAGPQWRDEARQLSARSAAGESRVMTTKRIRKDGTVVDVEVYALPLVVGGRAAGSYGLYIDITDRMRLQMYEKLLPVCCVCGKIRDESRGGPENSRWERLDHYVARHSDAQISHTFCPDCLLEYKKREGMA